ncbi:MAG TPA: cyclic nucleotide-binding domain-containing protein [Gaiellaceae bacterium]|nr:cyclic nucleotide-binding domain-containing protein [Gaiellaceae bacterium]
MLGRDAKTKEIARVPLFGRCSKRELALIAGIADEIDLRSGKVLTKEGETGREFFVLLDGKVEVRRGGRKRDILESGDFLGEIALVSRSPRTATVTALTPLRVLVIRDQEFRALIERVPSIQTKVLEVLADRLAADAL